MSAIRNLYKKFVVSEIKNADTVPDVAEWKILLANLGEPTDALDAAFKKYRCRSRYMSKKKALALDAAAEAVLLRADLRVKKPIGRLKEPEEGVLLVETRKEIDYHEVAPEELIARYPTVRTTPILLQAPYGELVEEAVPLYREARQRYRSHPYFVLFLLKELTKHSHYLLENNPAATALFGEERNLASPVLRKLYEDSGRKLISFMHGEYLLQLIQAYMGFSEYWVWDEQYVDMFSRELRCGIGEYHVYTPRKLRKKWHLEDIEPEYYCTYYFSGESERAVRAVAEVFRELQARGARCLVRPHPRYSHRELIDSVFGDMVEDPRSVSMEESLGRTRYVVGLSTTVHSEAYVEGRIPVIDDRTDPDKFRSLADREYIALKRPHRLLSELIEE